jgi:hypothetical protein
MGIHRYGMDMNGDSYIGGGIAVIALVSLIGINLKKIEKIENKKIDLKRTRIKFDMQKPILIKKIIRKIKNKIKRMRTKFDIKIKYKGMKLKNINFVNDSRPNTLQLKE